MVLSVNMYVWKKNEGSINTQSAQDPINQDEFNIHMYSFLIRHALALHHSGFMVIGVLGHIHVHPELYMGAQVRLFHAFLYSVVLLNEPILFFNLH